MKRKVQFIYIGVAVFLSALLNIVLIQRLQKTEKTKGQQSVESRLPTGDYLPDAENPLIRVVIKTNGFQNVTHTQVQLSAEDGLIIQTGGQVSEEKSVTLSPDDVRFSKGTVRIAPKTKGGRITVFSLERGCGTPSYAGILEFFSTAEGIVVVNELPVEQYLCAVVPSEMPASYQPEALKCQAICARSYAYCQMQNFAYPEYYAHVDDSVSYQVYGNSEEQQSTTRATEETNGKKLWYKNQVVKTYYYSTSSGHSTSVEAWGTDLTEQNGYLSGVAICDAQGNAYEKELPWYQWEAKIPQKTLENLIELNTGKEIGTLKNIEVTKTGVGDVVLELTITGSENTIKIETEHKIRSVLGGGGYEITKQDQTVISGTKLLPSAFFTIAKNEKTYIIRGGGYGHGIGMSQNGANEMAKTGMTCEEILQFFYPGTAVQ